MLQESLKFRLLAWTVPSEFGCHQSRNRRGGGSRRNRRPPYHRDAPREEVRDRSRHLVPHGMEYLGADCGNARRQFLCKFGPFPNDFRYKGRARSVPRRKHPTNVGRKLGRDRFVARARAG